MQILTSNTDHKYEILRAFSKDFFERRKLDPKSLIGSIYGNREIFDVVPSKDNSSYALITEIIDVEFQLVENSEEKKLSSPDSNSNSEEENDSVSQNKGE